MKINTIKYIVLGLFTLLWIGMTMMETGKTLQPLELYNVYLDGNYLGTIDSKVKLENYMNEKADVLIQTDAVIKEYCEITNEVQQLMNQYKYETNNDCVQISITDQTKVDKVYQPSGLEINKTLTHKNEISTVEEIYNEIVDVKSFTIKGYQFIIRKEISEESNQEAEFVINVTNKEIFESAINDMIEIYVGSTEYQAYLTETQLQIDKTGSIIENVYLQDTITYKEKNIDIDEKIYTDQNKLTQFLLFGDNPVTKTYKSVEGDTIASIADTNAITLKEFFISNPSYTSSNSFILPGTLLQIKETNSKILVVAEEYRIFDQESKYTTIYRYDESQYTNYQETIQTGVDGMERIKQTVKKINGDIVYIEPKGKETLIQMEEEIIVKGAKEYPSIGIEGKWAWPVNSGWVLTSDYGWRIHPISYTREFHRGIDLAGTGYGSPIYSINNGTVELMSYNSGYGYYIIVNHNNGYRSLYAHMSSFVSSISVGDTVAYGQQIGYMGSTGSSTAPHLHLEVYYGCATSSQCHISPWSLY